MLCSAVTLSDLAQVAPDAQAMPIFARAFLGWNAVPVDSFYIVLCRVVITQWPMLRLGLESSKGFVPTKSSPETFRNGFLGSAGSQLRVRAGSSRQ